MYSQYLQPVCTTSIHSQHVQSVSTASMHSQYVQRVCTASMYSQYVQPVCTASMYSQYVQPACTASIYSQYSNKLFIIVSFRFQPSYLFPVFLFKGRERIEDLFLGSRLPGRRYGNLLQVAVESGDERTVQVCLDQDPEIVRKCLAQEMEHGEGSLLHSACENGMEQCVVCVVETMTDQAELYMSRKDKLGFAPIHK